jgi:sulfatase modifying factor 1
MGVYKWFFILGIMPVSILLLLISCGTPNASLTTEVITTPTGNSTPTEGIITPTSNSTPTKTMSSLIAGMNWDPENHIINIVINPWFSSWPPEAILVNGNEIVFEEGSGATIRPNAPLNQPPGGLIIGSLPWVSGLDNVDFPCCGTIQIVLPDFSSTNEFSYDLAGDGCSTASTNVCAPQSNVRVSTTQNNPSLENMVLIPAGSFLMGRQDRGGWTPMADPDMFNDELPPHEVYVDAFYIDQYEVTNAQFMEFAEATQYITEAERDGASDVMVPIDQAETPLVGSDIGWSWMRGASWRTPEGPGSSIVDRMGYPVVHITWNDANEYAKWVGKRLPTEAEWEKAARGGTISNWFWGDDLDGSGKYANIYGEHRVDYQYAAGVYDGFDRTAPVGSLQPNQYGLYDMAGNVFEWTADWYQYDYFANSPYENPKGPESGTTKVIKGGGWYICECFMRPANREASETRDRNHGLGFRLAVDVH